MMAELWRLGVVASPEPGHENAIGRLCIPYINRAGVAAVKFRCLVNHDCKAEHCAKYTQPLGQETYLFNVLAVEDDATQIHITEGEFDAIILTSVLGEPAVGLPGATQWKQHYPWHFKGFDRVLVWPDGDKAGQDMASKVRKELPNAEIVGMPAGFDVTSLYLEAGEGALHKLAGEDEEDDG